MNLLVKSLLPLGLAASSVFGAGLTKTPGRVQGNYVEARTAVVYTGPCYANSEGGLVGELAVFGWQVSQGSYGGVVLDGLGVVGVVRAKSTLGDVHDTALPARSVIIVDERASLEQRLALEKFARRMGGDLLQDVVSVQYAPVELTVNGSIHNASASLKAGQLAKITTRAMTESDQLCHNENVWYQPLTQTTHAMPAFTTAHSFSGEGLGAKWSSPGKRSAYVGTFSLQE